MLVDMTGQQGTLVNNQPVSQVMLKNGDVIKAGLLELRYECIPVPPPLPPEDPPPSVSAPPLPVAIGYVQSPPPPMANGLASVPQPRPYVPGRLSAKEIAYEKGGKTSVPNVATAIHLYKWMLPVMGLIIWIGKWCWGFYRAGSEMDKEDAKAAAWALVEEFRQAHEAKAPLIENVHDAKHAVRLLRKGVNGAGEYSSYEFKVELDDDQAEDALEMLMWREGAGLTFKHEYRDRESEFHEVDDTTIDAGEDEIVPDGI